MAERGVSELRLRWMLEHVRRVSADSVPGRFVAEVAILRAVWEIVLEPDHEREVVVVVTLYNTEPR